MPRSENGDHVPPKALISILMKLDPIICYEAVRTRDRRFDGVFFVAVRTTRIYCRPVCKAQTPKFENCSYHPSAASAEKAGYRPCLRCRPELAPGHSSVDAVSRLAAYAMSRIEDGALSNGNVDELAEEMSITSRHLRRVVENEYGVSPIELAQTQRLLMAKRLLTDTSLPLQTVAIASGFSSVRRFNALFVERYRMNPSQLRKTSAPPSTEDSFVCALSFRAPYDWDSILTFLRSRACPGVEFVDSTKYMRTVSSGEHSGWISVRRSETKEALELTVSNSLAPALLNVVARVKRLFDLQTTPSIIETHLGALAADNPGLRVPGAFDGFEVAVRAILGQQVSVKGASSLAARLVALLGKSIATPFPELTVVYPSVDAIAHSDPSAFRALGIVTSRCASIVELAKLVQCGRLILSPGSPVESTMAQLKQIPGIGDWTAEYIAMRCLDWPDAFPYSDLGIRKALGLKSDKAVLAAAEKWRPWRAYAAMHLWKSLEKVGTAQAPALQMRKTK
jgi:AraC family transcriptional regulator of adaptative response / DNA-3-methyladenine glycosylase II